MYEKVELQEWAIENEPLENMRYYKGYWDQIIFIRDVINGIFHNTRDKMNSVYVISTHTSKSIELPVYLIEVKEYNLKIILRDNFHGWIITVISEVPLEIESKNLFDCHKTVEKVYAEGFKDSLVKNNYAENKKEFTINIDNKFKLYTFIHLMNNNITRK